MSFSFVSGIFRDKEIYIKIFVWKVAKERQSEGKREGRRERERQRGERKEERRDLLSTSLLSKWLQ